MQSSLVAVVVALVLGAGCGGDELVCVEVDLSCAPLYAPTWDHVLHNTLIPSCGTGNGVCHSSTGQRGGLVLDDPATAYANLVTRGYVTPGDVSCSELTERIFSTSAELLMPRGSRLNAPEACAVAQWVAAGAPGPGAGVDAP